MALQESAVYCTLLLSDSYLLGALVLAHSLRDNGTNAKLAILYTPDTLQPKTINKLETTYDDLIPVTPIPNTAFPVTLWLMNRPDLITTFTKIELWRLTQYNRIVYIDSDVVALRAPDELLTLSLDLDLETGIGRGVKLAAAPDVGWPDCFNSGVMVLRPDLRDYTALRGLAERGVSFDGADQGLLNMYFGADADHHTNASGSGSSGGGKGWQRLSFGYNCTPSVGYQYLPAYRHYGDSVSLVHYIGEKKPWEVERGVVSGMGVGVGMGEEVYGGLVGRWWEVWGRHYGQNASKEQLGEMSTAEPYSVTESHTELPIHQVFQCPTGPHHSDIASDPASQTSELQTSDEESHAITSSAVSHHIGEEEQLKTETSYTEPLESRAKSTSQQHPEPEPPTTIPTPTFEAPMSQWDASREPPPPNTKPEGISLHQQTYTMSNDTRLFTPPEAYPEAPRNMYYEVPSTKPEPEKVTRVFPWEGWAPRATRVFPGLNEEGLSEIGTETGAETESETMLAPMPGSVSGSLSGSMVTFTDEQLTANTTTTNATTTTEQGESCKRVYWNIEKPTESWKKYTRSNAWDEIPGIQRYVESIENARKGRKKQNTSRSGPTVTKQATEGPSKNSNLSPNIPLNELGPEVEESSLTVTPVPSTRGADTPPSELPIDHEHDHSLNSDDSNNRRADGRRQTLQEEWISTTADGLLQFLQVVGLYWEFVSAGNANEGGVSAVIGLIG